jgi:hypothetical protein
MSYWPADPGAPEKAEPKSGMLSSARPPVHGMSTWMSWELPSGPPSSVLVFIVCFREIVRSGDPVDYI